MASESGKLKKLLKKIMLGTLIALLSFSVSSFAASPLIFRAVFSRSEVDEYGIELIYEDIDREKYTRESVTFPSGNNLLRGYIYGEGGARLLVVSHGMNSGADGCLPVIMYFVDRGWTVFAYDNTGTRQSGGGGTVGIPQAKLDLSAALSYIADAPGLSGLPTALYGFSLGAYAAASVLAQQPNVRAAVCVSGFNEPLGMMLYMSRQYVGEFADVQYPFIALENLLLFGDDANVTALDGINSTDIPVLLISGSEDTAVPFEQSIQAQEARTTNKNAVFTVVTEEYRNLHSTVCLSYEAAKYRARVLDELGKLKAEYENNIPREVYEAFRGNIDITKLYELDDGLMSEINAFLSRAAG